VLVSFVSAAVTMAVRKATAAAAKKGSVTAFARRADEWVGGYDAELLEARGEGWVAGVLVHGCVLLALSWSICAN
jgi:hypothetical protein